MDVPTFDLQDELAGAVRSVVVERVELRRADGKPVETQPRLVLKTNYDDKGRQLEELSYDPQGVFFKKTLRTYDPTGELQEIRAYAPDGSLMSRQVYSYDSANRTFKELADNGRKTTETVYSLDERGKVISQTTVNSDEQLSIRLVMQYDVRGRLSEIATCVNDSQQLAIVPGDAARKSVMLSDEMRQRLKGKGPCSDGLLTSKIVFSRDHSGHLVEATIYSGDGVLVEKNGYSREYDSHGNWIKETLSKWNSESDRFEPATLTLRKILYR